MASATSSRSIWRSDMWRMRGARSSPSSRHMGCPPAPTPPRPSPSRASPRFRPRPQILPSVCAQCENPGWKPKNVPRRASSKRTAHLCQNLLMSHLAMISPLA